MGRWKDELSLREEMGYGDFDGEDYYEEEESENEFNTKVVGVTFEGRQRYIRRMSVGEDVTLERDPSNIHDKNAIKVINKGGYQIGFISRDLAEKMAPNMDNGIKYKAEVSAITGTNPGDNFGVNLLIKWK